MALSLNQIHSGVASVPPNLPLDEQIQAISAIALPSLHNTSPEDLKSFSRNLKYSADNLIRDENILHFTLLSGAILPDMMKKLRDNFAPEKAFEKAGLEKSFIEKTGKKKWVEISAAYNSILPPSLASLFQIKTTKKELSAEFDSVAKMTVEEFEDKTLDRYNLISKSLNRLEKRLTLSTVTVASRHFIDSMTPERTEALICTGAGFLTDLFENAQKNNPLTITNTKQGKAFAKSLNQSLVFLEKALEEAGVIDTPEQRKSLRASPAPGNA